MNTKRTIRKILFAVMWLVICSGMLTLFIAAMGKQKKELCKGYSIVIKARNDDNFFLDEKEITKLLKTATKGNIKGQSKTVLNLQQMEGLLEKNVWIKDAQLYFDNNAVLHISVDEREPLARIFTTEGESFYIDETEKKLPLSERAIAKVPVFTGFPEKMKQSKEDSALLHDVNSIAQYINDHPFWSSQVAQINIVEDVSPNYKEFEMIPVIGRHIVKLGDGNNIEQKFQRLFAFYQQVLSRSGMDYYKTIDVRFDGQVIGGKSENPRVDSVQLRKNVEGLLRQMNELTKSDNGAEQGITSVITPDVETNKAEVSNNNPDLLKRTNNDPVSTHVRQNRAGNENHRSPKAVMPRRTN